MVLADSHRIPRVPCYLGVAHALVRFTCTGLSPSTAVLSSTFQFSDYCVEYLSVLLVPSRYPALTTAESLTSVRFGLIPVRSPLLRESFLLSFPEVT